MKKQLKELFDLKRQYNKIDFIINKWDCDTAKEDRIKKCFLKVQDKRIYIYLFSDDSEGVSTVYALAIKAITEIEKELLYDMDNPNTEKAMLAFYDYYNSFNK